jgi:hypothetical protein
MRTPQPPNPLLVDRIGAARLLGISPGSVDNARNRGELPSLKIGARRLFAVADLLALIEARRGVKS